MEVGMLNHTPWEGHSPSLVYVGSVCRWKPLPIVQTKLLKTIPFMKQMLLIIITYLGTEIRINRPSVAISLDNEKSLTFVHPCPFMGIFLSTPHPVWTNMGENIPFMEQNMLKQITVVGENVIQTISFVGQQCYKIIPLLTEPMYIAETGNVTMHVNMYKFITWCHSVLFTTQSRRSIVSLN